MRGSERVRREWFHVDNGRGWDLALYRTVHPDHYDRSKRAVFVVPGYGMNSYIFNYHPGDRSIIAALADAGHEVFTVDLREQGRSSKTKLFKSAAYGLGDLALTDLASAMDAAVAHKTSRPREIDLVGASLGGTLSLLYRTQHPKAVEGRVVLMGSPVRWVQSHPLLGVLFRSPMLAGAVGVRGTRQMAKLALPTIAKVAPWALKLYLNPDATDLGNAAEMIHTVEDPSRHVNREMAHWIRRGDLLVNGRTLADDVARFDAPLATFFANGDGIVPAQTATFAHGHARSTEKLLVRAGSDSLPYSHADLFVARDARQQVFEPLVDFLNKR
ncbi:MAG: alpha/beta fold hydrolase [Deltaproteobacteria bacterium]|nr:alpha/beta fold hydrolase [Deltaproteobacteria bacterium]